MDASSDLAQRADENAGAMGDEAGVTDRKVGASIKKVDATDRDGE